MSRRELDVGSFVHLLGLESGLLAPEATYRIEQLLTERNFEALPLQVDAAAVLDRLGPPSERRVGWRGVGEVWSYRFEDWFWPCRWFQVWLVDGRVREAGYGTDPVCEESRLLD